jgi:O-antigen/teichoic acid export membrane protein
MSCALLIVAFVKVYTSGISDCNYERPLFAVLLVVAEAIYCVRDPYVSVVYAAGHYKETAVGAYAEAIINIVFSVLLVGRLGLEGIALGTLVAMLFRMIYHIIYLKNHILNRSLILALKRIFVSLLIIVSAYVVCEKVDIINITNYFTWFVQAIMYAFIVALFIIVYNVIFYFTETKQVIKSI